MHFLFNHYGIECLDCHTVFRDNRPFLLDCKEHHRDCLVRATYHHKTFSTENSLPGLFRFARWLPVKRILKEAPQPVAYKSKGLASLLGLKNLFIVFNGYWPEKNAHIDTCSFKELEAYTVCARTPENFSHTLVIPSVGNTAKGFIKVCSKNDIPALIVVPKTILPTLRVPHSVNPKVKIIALDGESDYEDAVTVSIKLSRQKGFTWVGGTKNIAKRDGLATSLLAAVETMGELPNHYFQAVGSGAGGIGAWEMSQRLLEDGCYGNQKLKLHLSQTQACQLMVDAWHKRLPHLPLLNRNEVKQKKINTLRAHVLANLKPVYSIKGGVYDAMKDTSGYMYKISDREAQECGYQFEKTEGCDVGAASEVAIASLFQAVAYKHIQKDDLIVLNITDGGPNRLKQEKKLYQCQPDVVLDSAMVKDENVDCYIANELFGKGSDEYKHKRNREDITAHP